jgi:hypothetical protein
MSATSRLTFAIRGRRELLAKLAKIPKRVANAIIRKELKKALEPIRDTAMSLAPVGSRKDGSDKPGQLKRSIRIGPPRKRNRNRITQVVYINRRMISYVSENPHPKRFAGGWQERPKKNKKRRTIFMARAREMRKDMALAIAEKAILAAIDAEIARGSG